MDMNLTTQDTTHWSSKGYSPISIPGLFDMNWVAHQMHSVTFLDSPASTRFLPSCWKHVLADVINDENMILGSIGGTGSQQILFGINATEELPKPFRLCARNRGSRRAVSQGACRVQMTNVPAKPMQKRSALLSNWLQCSQPVQNQWMLPHKNLI